MLQYRNIISIPVYVFFRTDLEKKVKKNFSALLRTKDYLSY